MSSRGSSPRVWGIRLLFQLADVHVRFIPTRVGNTGSIWPGPSPPPVHPHACGEYFRADTVPDGFIGSSPRVWGIPWALRVSQEAARFIPTRVGNTAGASPAAHAGPVHPHACGEYTKNTQKQGKTDGSSPRVWGILEYIAIASVRRRFIPTRVGNTLQEDAKNNSLLAELQRATEPCVLQACSDDDKKGKELCKAAPSPRKTLPGRAVTLS